MSPGETAGPAPQPAPTAITHTSQLDGRRNAESSRTMPPRVSAAEAFRDGYRRGAADALRLAARRIDDPYIWLVLDELASEYDLVSGDG